MKKLPFFRRILALMLLTVFSAISWADDAYDLNGGNILLIHDHIRYVLNTQTKEAMVGDGLDYEQNALEPPKYGDADYGTNYWRDLVIPSEISYNQETYSVTSIAWRAFARTTYIHNITLPETLSSINSEAFYMCTELESVTIPEGVTTIESGAFMLCRSLKSVHLPNTVTEIKDKVFSDCYTLEEINIPGACTKVGIDAFTWCRKLFRLNIEDSENVLSLGYSYAVAINYITSSPKEPVYRGQFADCPLTEIYLGRNLSFPNSEDGKNRPCTPFEREYLNYFYIIGEGGYLFDIDQLTLEIGDFVTSLPDRLFYGLKIKNKVVFPDNLKIIGSGVFSNALKGNNELILPEGIEYIGSDAFANNSISGVLAIPEGIEYIGSAAFANNSISGMLSLPEGIEYIGGGAFANNSIEEISLPDGIQMIVGFNGNKIRELTIPSSVTQVITGAFSDNPLRNVNCNTETPPSESNPFADATIYVPAGKGNAYRQQWSDALIVDSSDEIISINVKTAGTLYSRLLAQDYNTSDVSKLKLRGTLNVDDMTIINEMSNLYYLDLSAMQTEEIPNGLFQCTPRLVNIILPETLTAIHDYEFNGCNNLTGEIQIPASCTSIGISSFANTAIKSLVYSGAISIGDSAFKNCYGLHELDITSGSTIGECAFQGTRIHSITIDSGASVGENAFKDSELKEVILESNVNGIGDGAFGSKLEKITFNGPVNSIGNVSSEKLSEVHVSDIITWCQLPFADGDIMKSSPQLYIGEEEVTDVVIPESISDLRDYAFFNCQSLKSVILSEGIKSIGNNTFQDCGELVTVKLPSKLTSIGESAFSGCSKLSSMTIPSGIDIVQENTFKDCAALASLSLPTTMTSIQQNAFSGCSSLIKLDLPSSITSIEQHAFENCSALQTVAVHWDNPITIGDVFTLIPSDCYLYCPINTATKYFNAGWNVFTNLKEAGILSVKANSGGTVSCYDTSISGGEDDVFFTPYKSFYVNLTPEDGFVIKKVKLNNENVISQVEDNKLFLEEPEENMSLSVVFADENIHVGDVNGDYIINVTDAICIVNHILKNTSEDFHDYAADTNDDEVINVTDAIIIVQQITNSNSIRVNK